MKLVLALLMVLGIIASFYILCGINDAQASLSHIEPTSVPHNTFLPVVRRSDSLPVIYNCEGSVTTRGWLKDRFGAVSWTQGISGTLAAIHPCCGDCPASITIHVNKPGIPVMLYWPDAPMLPLELRDCGLERGVFGYTNQNGDIGFGLGRGSYYEPPAGGPHTAWTVGGPCVSGIGMLAFSGHAHLDLDIEVP